MQIQMAAYVTLYPGQSGLQLHQLALFVELASDVHFEASARLGRWAPNLPAELASSAT